MIVEFSVKNFRSIKELQTISFVASNLKSAPEYEEVDKNNIVEEGGMRLLKTVGIYGPNASGKSNIVRALSLFCKLVGSSPAPQPSITLSDPFIYRAIHPAEESFFQVIVLLEGKKYRYGLTTRYNAIVDEWLYGPANKNMVPYFIRKVNKESIEKEKIFLEANDIPALEHEHVPYLAHVASYKKEIAYRIWNYLSNNVISNVSLRNNIGDGHRSFRDWTVNLVKTPETKKVVLDFLSVFNLNYTDITLGATITAGNSKSYTIFVMKEGQTSDNQKIPVALNLDLIESSGTQKLFNMAGILLAALTGNNSMIIVLDELDSNFHPALLIKLIEMFNNPKVNVSNGQLLFTTHDTNLLSPAIMRRDQFYFTEKDSKDATRLYSLADLKGIRNDADFAKQYLSGFYGALPVLDNYLEEKEVTRNE